MAGDVNVATIGPARVVSFKITMHKKMQERTVQE
jgi:hypothetical protein